MVGRGFPESQETRILLSSWRSQVQRARDVLVKHLFTMLFEIPAAEGPEQDPGRGCIQGGFGARGGDRTHIFDLWKCHHRRIEQCLVSLEASPGEKRERMGGRHPMVPVGMPE